MKEIVRRFAHLPIRWKLMVWSSILLFVLIVAYNGIQYFVLDYWFYKQEKTALYKKMSEIDQYFTEKRSELSTGQFEKSRRFLIKANERNQMIRIIDRKGNPVLTVSNALPPEWVAPFPVTEYKMQSAWHQEDHLLILRAPLNVKGFAGSIEIIRNLVTMDMLLGSILGVMTLCAAGGIVISGLAGTLLAKQLLAPVKAMAETMKKIQVEGLSKRVETYNNRDELAELAMIFNDMMERLEESFEQQVQFVEDASHELRTPISIIEGHLTMLSRWGKNDPEILSESLETAKRELQRLKKLVQDLLALTRTETQSIDSGPVEAVNLAEIILQIQKNLAVMHPDFTFSAQLEGIKNTKIRIRSNHFEQILLILLDNAVKYSGEVKLIKIIGKKHGGWIRIEVIDKGIGIPSGETAHVFDRFYRVDKARSRERGGYGLGLSIAKTLTVRYRGRISAESREGEGTRMILDFPAT